jgi:hypothetical protein
MPLALAMDYDWDRRAFSLHTLRTFAQFVQPMSASLGDRRELARPLSALAAIQGHFLSAFAARPTESIRNLNVSRGGSRRVHAARRPPKRWTRKKKTATMRSR